MYVISQAPAAAAITLAAGAATATFNVIAGEPGAGTQVNLNVPGSNKLNGQPFRVRAAGTVAVAAGTYTTAATPVKIILCASNTASFAAVAANAVFSGTAVAAYTWTSAVAGGLDWSVEGYFVGTNTSGKLGGLGISTFADANGVSTVTTSNVAATNSPSSVNFATEPPLQFSLAVITAGANLLASPVMSITQFQLEA
jgi:hypothetical protein